MDMYCVLMWFSGYLICHRYESSYTERVGIGSSLPPLKCFRGGARHARLRPRSRPYSKAKHLSLLAASLPHQLGMGVTLALPKKRKMSSMLKLKPASKAAARM